MTETASSTLLSPSFITDATGAVWGLAPSVQYVVQVVRNGAIDMTTKNVAFLFYTNHIIYHKNTSDQWYQWQTSLTWTSVPDPTKPVVVESPEGTTVTTVGPAIIDSTLTSWTLVDSSAQGQGMQIAVNGTVDSVTHQVTMLYYHNHMLYQQNVANEWYYKAKSTDSWSYTATDPRPGPTPTPTPSPSIISYGTKAPASVPNVTGAVSPLGWKCSFFEDFTGPLTTISTSGGSWGQGQCTTGYSTWDYVICWGGGNGQSNLNRANMSIANSVATFKVTVDKNNISGAPYSGCGITNNTLNKKWGYWEFNMKMPLSANGNQAGLWGIGWLTALNGGTNWPQEVDVFEQLNQGNNSMGITLHYGSSGSSDTPVSMPATLPFDSTTGFHTYGCLVCPNYIAFYADGKFMGVRYRTGVGSPSFNGLDGVSGSGPSASQSTRYHYSYDVMQTLVGAYCGQSWNPNVSSGQLPCQLQCDWIRYSELNAN